MLDGLSKEFWRCRNVEQHLKNETPLQRRTEEIEALKRRLMKIYHADEIQIILKISPKTPIRAITPLNYLKAYNTAGDNWYEIIDRDEERGEYSAKR